MSYIDQIESLCPSCGWRGIRGADPCAFCEVVRLQHALDERTRERDAGRYYLKMLAERLGVPLDGAHDANPGERILLAVETLLVDAQCCY